MRRYRDLTRIVLCPVCKEKRREGEMMCGTKKEICKYCHEKEKWNERQRWTVNR